MIFLIRKSIHKYNVTRIRRFYSFIPRAVVVVARLPVAAAGAGLGISAFFHYQVQDWSIWLKDKRDEVQEFYDVLKKQLFLILDNEANDGNINENVDNDIPPVPMKVNDNVILQTIDVTSHENDLVGLTKILIQVRSLLRKLNDDGSETMKSLSLPSIVVIGSQSSGKSSVLEAIVGHQFLPKGSNMVTRRPIELTLVHNQDSTDEYAEFPQLQLGKISSFEKVQQTLTELNLAVSEEECVSSNPIELVITSPNVPDLSLVDLPGYIQISNKNQPALLKRKIAELCETYIQYPNIILAVSAADVDLANSEALRASRRVDPSGSRTIGVLTKMDLIDAERGSLLLSNSDYPLSLGYIGVVNSPQKGFASSLSRTEESFFKKHTEYKALKVGSVTLRKTLKHVLEDRMSKSLVGIIGLIEKELEDTSYQFKVHYNDRGITPESYVADCIDILKMQFKEFSRKFQKSVVKDAILDMLNQRVISICSLLYWDRDHSPTEKEKETLLSDASMKLTRSGVGKASVELIMSMIKEKIQEFTNVEPWTYHNDAREKVLHYATELLSSKFGIAVDQVENTIKPFKFEVDISDSEWKEGQQKAADILTSHIIEIQEEMKAWKLKMGRRRARRIIKYLNFLKANPETPLDGTFTDPEISIGKQLMSCQQQESVVSQRLVAVKSRSCANYSDKESCPEVFLSAVSEKLATTAVLFIYIELLNEFFFQLPRQIDNQLYYSLGKSDIEAFCKENPSIHQHLLLQERKATLEKINEKLSALKRNW